MMPSTSNVHIDSDDKYAKFASSDAKYNKIDSKHIPDPLKKYRDKTVFFSLAKLPVYVICFAFFVVASCFAFISVGGVFDVNLVERFSALQLEILGLLTLRHKINTSGSVSGVSGMTFVMYTAVYFCRVGVALPYRREAESVDAPVYVTGFDWDWKTVDFDVTLGFCSFLLVLDILRSVFIKYRSSYQVDLDVFKAWYLIPACWTVSLLVRPSFPSWPWLYGYWWSSTLYMDVLALMPQVVMMSMAGGKVATPVANFVAATAISRCGDLIHSLVWVREMRVNEPFNYWLAVSVQLLHLVLVADFMYYFCKARGWAKKEAEELTLAEV